MRSARGTALALTALVVVAMAAALAPAGGAANSRVTVGIGFDPSGPSPFFRGMVKSGRKSCVAGRPIRVYRQQNKANRVLFGSDRTEPDGSWKVPLAASMKTAAYVAVVKARAGCAKGFSDPIAVGQRGPGGAGPGGSGA